MASTVRHLIARAYYLAGVVSPEFQEVTGFQETEGLEALNDALAVEEFTQGSIPYFNEYEFDFVAGQEKYSVPYLIDTENVVYILNTVRYPLVRVSRNDYFGAPRAENIGSIPYKFHVERTKDGSDIYFYFIPSQNYHVKLWGKFGLAQVTDLEFDLSTVYNHGYLTYLKYRLAQFICEINDKIFSEQAQKKLDQLINSLQYLSPLDLSIQKVSTMGRQYVMNYAWANLGNGWVP